MTPPSKKSPAPRVGAPTRALLTGGAGALAQRVISRLGADPSCERLVVCDREAPELSVQAEGRVFGEALDLTHPVADQRVKALIEAHEINTVIHLGFLALPTHHSAWAHEVEAIGTLHLLNGCAAAGVDAVLLQSSTAVYGPHPRNPNFLSEDQPLRGVPASRFVCDRVEAERLLARFKRDCPETRCVSLRLAPLLGGTVPSWASAYLRHPFPLTLLGFDPLVQFLNEIDAADAVVMAAQRAVDGPLNITGDGVLPLSVALRLCGGTPFPLPELAARAWISALWSAQLSPLPASFVAFLKHLCVADSSRAASELGFQPRYSTREALLAFAAGERPAGLEG